MRASRLLSLSLTLALALSAWAAPASAGTIVIGASPTPHAEILMEAAKALKDKGVELKIVEYADYVQPNVALESGDLDANYFQHKPYMDDFNTQKGTKLVSMAAIHYEPFGIYAGRTRALADLKDGAIVSVPNDTTNEARALLLLQEQGLVKLRSNALTVTRLDIVENPKKLRIEELEAAQLVRSLPDVDISIINGNYALLGGLKVKDALAVESAGSLAATTFGNIIAVREGHASNADLRVLVDVLKSEAMRTFMIEKYEGAVLPVD